MNCEQSWQVQAYYDDELSADARREMEAHLRECAACQQELEREGGLPRPGSSLEQVHPIARETAAKKFVQPGDARGNAR